MKYWHKIAGGVVLLGGTLGGGTVAVDNQINPYTTKGDTLEIQSTSTLPEAGTNKIIADKSQPKITLQKWNGEVAMGITYQGLTSQGDRPFLSKNITWTQDPKQSMEAVPIDATTTAEDGGMEINIVLNQKPASNVFNFAIDGADNLDFFYQPPLTDEEIKEGALRPDNVISSYAVYYKNHANHIEGQTNYATGKAYHIYRPMVTDANGLETWADLAYSDGVLTVTVPHSYLDVAKYPVKVDPTFGYTTAGGTFEYVGGNGSDFRSQRDGYTVAGVDGTLTSLTAYFSTSAAVDRPGFIFLNIQNGSGADSHTEVFSGGITQITPYTKAAYTATAASQALSSANTYVLNVSSQDPGSFNNAGAYYDTTGSATNYLEVFSNASQATAFTNSKESPWTNASTGTGRSYSIYATYTASVAATPQHAIISQPTGTNSQPSGTMSIP